jgi:two-component system chemotaxis response regulator CheY
VKALVVDDSSAMRRIQQKALETLGFSVLTAADGQKALDVLRAESSFDLLLTDWHMPEMDGLALVKAVRGEARWNAVRIVMVTSESVLGAIEQAIAAGANDFLMKPFSREALAERVAEVMGG